MLELIEIRIETMLLIADSSEQAYSKKNVIESLLAAWQGLATKLSRQETPNSVMGGIGTRPQHQESTASGEHAYEST